MTLHCRIYSCLMSLCRVPSEEGSGLSIPSPLVFAIMLLLLITVSWSVIFDLWSYELLNIRARSIYTHMENDIPVNYF